MQESRKTRFFAFSPQLWYTETRFPSARRFMVTLPRFIPWKGSKAVPLAILLGLPALAYVTSLGNGFVWDDHGVIGTHIWVQDLSHIPFLFSPEYWTQHFPGLKGQYRPLRAITFSLQYAVWGLNPVPYHAFNVIFHLVNVWLVYRLLFRLVGRTGPAWLGALLFGLHPLHTEVVVWIKNRTEILALLFSLLALEAYFRSQETQRTRQRALWAASSALACGMAVLSKEVALILPILPLAHALLLAPSRKPAVLCGLPLFLPVVLFVLHKVLFLQPLSDGAVPALPLDTHALLVLRTVGTYLGLLLAPLTLKDRKSVV